MKKSNDIKSKNIAIRLSEKELQLIKTEMLQTTSRSQGEYLRNKVLNQAVTIKYRNISLDDYTQTLAELKEELKTLDYHFETTWQKINTLIGSDESAHWIINFDLDRRKVLKHIEKISEYLHKLSEHDWNNV